MGKPLVYRTVSIIGHSFMVAFVAYMIDSFFKVGVRPPTGSDTPLPAFLFVLFYGSWRIVKYQYSRSHCFTYGAISSLGLVARLADYLAHSSSKPISTFSIGLYIVAYELLFGAIFVAIGVANSKSRPSD